LPLLYNLDIDLFNPFFISFEKKEMKPEELLELNEIKNRFSKRITYLNSSSPKIAFLPSSVVFLFYNIFLLIKIIRGYHIDLVHARSFIPALLTAIIKKVFRFKIALLYDNRGLYIDELIYTGILEKGSIKEKIFRKLENLIYKESNHIVVVSNEFKKYLSSKIPHSPKNIVEKISVIPNRAKIDYSILPEILIEQKSKNKIIGVYSGSAAKWQNIDKLFELISIVVKEMKNFHFNIITYHPTEFELKLLEFEYLKQYVSIKKLKSKNVGIELIQCNFAILLREDNKINNVSSPLKISEYLAAGLPIIISKGIGDTEQIISKYNVGSIIYDANYMDAIKKIKMLLMEKDISERCIYVAKKEYDIEQSFIEYKSIYKQLLSVTDGKYN
jgi:glycosyltransferase involved in cell wall biosynthesis